jgi:sucrose phosphorylase
LTSDEATVDLRRHLPAPDYERPLLELRPEQRQRLRDILVLLYGEELTERSLPELERLMRVYHAHKTPAMLAADAAFDPTRRFDERDVVLITYGDLLASPGRRPLAALAEFAGRFLRGSINTIHLLPFFPYSSDRGFAVIDFEDVDPRLGTWEEVERLGLRFRLMFDGVFNHVSSRSRWFQRFLNGRPGYESWFVTFTGREAISPEHLQLILRPRTSDLLTPFPTIHGKKWVWTTFGPDQVDLNFRNPEVLLRVVEVLLLYVRRGADTIRLDAITYIWRALGTSCAHLKEGHALVQLFRAVLDVVAPRVALITETNVPHEDNVAYFGDGWNEAQMVYNFALPPLTLHTFVTGDASKLSRWAAGLTTPSPATTFFNFLDSHDGIGLMGARGLLSDDDVAGMIRRVEDNGGLVSYRSRGDGTHTPYELNVTWYSALNKEGSVESVDLQVARFVASRSIALALSGVPGIYLPSLFGSKNDIAAVRAGEGARAINRDTLYLPALMRRLRDPSSWTSKVARRFARLIRTRIGRSAFHPRASQQVLEGLPGVFAVLRAATDGSRVLALTNVTARETSFSCSRAALDSDAVEWRDLLSRRRLRAATDRVEVRLAPYEVLWLAPCRLLPGRATAHRAGVRRDHVHDSACLASEGAGRQRVVSPRREGTAAGARATYRAADHRAVGGQTTDSK